MTERIQKAINIWLDAINNGTLAKGYCTACAVGNLVAHGKGTAIIINRSRFFDWENGDAPSWGGAFTTDCGTQEIDNTKFDDIDVLEDVEATDFSIEELMQIEYAFETHTFINGWRYGEYSPKEIRRDQIRGLEAVVKVMLEFDEQKDDVKEVFTKKVEAIAI